ncbi:MAG TPA: L-histidine N(alpha)-methyltransferase [Candidatus Saccharimonadales bacterium]|nr:L-histidine N(alpha)-methyltransferase [Candidatus Saccharimonadales bacterium]
MKYFKNTELAKLYNVSEKSVRNWIEAAKEGKLDLQLFYEGERAYIADSTKNSNVIERLVDKGKKYKNSRGHKVISPTAAFYELFDAKDIFDIVSNLDIYKEIPLQYSYFDGGAKIWDTYVQRLAGEDSPNILKNTIELLNLSEPYIEGIVGSDAKINVVDIGPGNCYPVRELLEKLVKENRLNRYICIDISPSMLEIAEKNIRKWFGKRVKFEGYTRDITYERFDDLLALDSFDKEQIIHNVVLFLGSTMSNFREPSEPLHTIHNSMGKNDLLVFSKQLDTLKARRYFDFYTQSEEPGHLQLPPKSRFAIELLNIDRSLYDIELFFDKEKMSRRAQVRLKVALSIEFNLNGRAKVINFNKGDSLLLYRHNHQDTFQTISQLDKNSFDVLGVMTSKDGECILSISKVKSSDLI